MNELTACPNCSAKLKDTIFGSNSILSAAECELLSEFNKVPNSPGCQKCKGEDFKNAYVRFKAQKSELQKKLSGDINNVPIVTTHSPFNWDYKVLGIATGQSTTGTGLFSEVSSSWTDLFGMQSSAYNNKIAHGEVLCGQQIRSKAIEMGGNAVIAVDIDYAEMGGEKGMIMVCMAGTVIKLNNLEVLDQFKIDSLHRLSVAVDQLHRWNNKYAHVIKEHGA